jgi:membrane protease subunit (stomatin/prohibitin family)
MSQGSNWNPIDRDGESLHASKVANVRELKFCEGCGVLFVRLPESKALFCPECKQLMQIARRRIQ